MPALSSKPHRVGFLLGLTSKLPVRAALSRRPLLFSYPQGATYDHHLSTCAGAA